MPYQNPVGPGIAAAGIGGVAWLSNSTMLMLLFVLLAAFTVVNMLGAITFRVLPAGITERPRAAMRRMFGKHDRVIGSRTVKRYDFRRRQR